MDNKTGDTVFMGRVSKFRNIYYFTQYASDSSYLIHAVKISDNLIYGLNTAWTQYQSVDNEIRNGNNKELIKYINSDSSIIRLHPYKRELRKLFSGIIKNLPPDTIINIDYTYKATDDTVIVSKGIDLDDFSHIKNVYPNPAIDIVTVELEEKGSVKFQMIDVNGKLILEGQLNELVNKIDISKFKSGKYSLIIINEEEREQEVVKIIKVE